MEAPKLDHLILLVPSLSSQDVDFLVSAGFSLLPGGQHADGLTENALVVLPDGIYLEVIAFTADCPADKKASHWWGNKRPGWIDWSLTPTPRTANERVAAINSALGSKVYNNANSGGRRTKDGKDLEWKVAFPVVPEGETRGKKPFFCEDVTPREWRVPGHATSHPNNATGIASLTLLASPDAKSFQANFEVISNILSAATGADATHQFELGSPLADGIIKVYLRSAETDEERRWVQERGEGLYEITVHGQGKDGKIGGENGARIGFE